MSECTTAEFRIGDVVRLKSGGPDMTIVGMMAEDGEDTTVIAVEWFDGDDLRENEFLDVTVEHSRQSAAQARNSDRFFDHFANRAQHIFESRAPYG